MKYLAIAIAFIHVNLGTLPCCADTSLYRMNIPEISKHQIDVKDVRKHAGDELAVIGNVSGFTQKDGLIFVDMGGKYPNGLTIILKGPAKVLLSKIIGKRIMVVGAIIALKSETDMVVEQINQIKIL
jgi:hypothetical protein